MQTVGKHRLLVIRASEITKASLATAACDACHPINVRVGGYVLNNIFGENSIVPQSAHWELQFLRSYENFKFQN